MRKCWESEPCDRPTFRKNYSDISQYINKIAGYLDMGFNPFSEGKGGGGGGEGGGGEGGGGGGEGEGRGESRRCDEIDSREFEGEKKGRKRKFFGFK